MVGAMKSGSRALMMWNVVSISPSAWPGNWVDIHPEDAKKRGIESADMVMMYSDRVPVFKDTILGVHGKDFRGMSFAPRNIR